MKEKEFLKKLLLDITEGETISGIEISIKQQLAKVENFEAETTSSKILALLGGGDWTDASVNHYAILKPEININDEYNEYSNKGGFYGNDKKFFYNVLIEKGIIRDITESDPIIVIYE